MCSCYVTFRISLLQCNFICKISLLIGGEKEEGLQNVKESRKACLYIYLTILAANSW